MTNKKLLSICMIVKNEAEVLPLTLPSLMRIADEVIIVDTGSTDGTQDIALSMGARLEHFTWVDDYSAARNYAISFAKSEWILYTDADELMGMESGKKLRTELMTATSHAFTLNIYESEFGQTDRQTYGQRIRIFRNHQGFHFVRPISERVVNAAGEFAVGPVVEGVEIIHWGKHLTVERMEEKRARYIGMYKKFLESHPNDGQVHFLLALSYKEEGKLDFAITHYMETARCADHPSLSRAALTEAAWLHFQKRQISDAVRIARGVLQEDSSVVSAHNLIASILLAGNKPELAIDILKSVVQTEIPPMVSGGFVDANQYRTLPYYLLGNAYKMCGDLEHAHQAFQQSYDVRPTDLVTQELLELKKEITYVR